MPRLPEEIGFWIRSGVFGLAIAGVYWYLSYEVAGSVLLALFGTASIAAAATLGFLVWRLDRGRAGPRASGVRPDPTRAEGPLGDDRGRLPGASIAPLVIGIGIAIAALGLAYGPWLLLAALAPLLIGAASWIASANAELTATERSGGVDFAPHGEDREE
jgi:hypothetical protein